jgi:hypothetical protein
MNCLSLLLILFGSFNPEAQADALLNHAIETELSASGLLSAIDDSGYVWLVGRFDRKLCVSRIDPEGNLAFDRVPIPTGDFSTGEQLIFDRWDNAYFIFNNDVGGNPGLVNLVRITPEGQAEDRYPWRVKQLPHPYYMVILPGDTLVTYAQAYSGPGEISVRPWTFQIGKVHLTVDGYGATQQTFHKMGEFPIIIGVYFDDTQSIPEWNEGWSIVAYLRSASLSLYRQHLTAESNYSVDTIGTYAWRDYVWRTYSDTYIKRLTFTKHKDGGYILCLFNPEDRSTTHVLRLDEDGVPIDPSELKSGGSRSAKAFKNLPPSSDPYVDLQEWYHFNPNTRRVVDDSVHVIFWGCDDEGNLYAYRKVKKF